MVHVFYVFLFLSDFLFESLDKTPIILYGGLGWLCVVRRWRIASPSIMLFSFAVYLFGTALILENTRVLIQYAVLFFLYAGLLSYILVQIAARPGWYDQAAHHFVSWQTIVVLVGCFDYIALAYGYMSPIRDYVVSNKVDSVFSNPNPFGVMSALAFCFAVSGYGGRRPWLVGVKCLLCIGGVLLSDSSSALLLPCCFFVFKLAGRARLYFSFVMLFFAVFSLLTMDLSLFDSILNKRLEIWGGGLDMWANSRFFGIGTGNFQALNSSFGGASSEYGLHSMYMWLLIETGLIGGGFGLGLLVLVLLRANKHLDRAFLYPLMLSILLSQVTEFFLDHEEVFSMLFFLIVARTYANVKNREINA